MSAAAANVGLVTGPCVIHTFLSMLGRQGWPGTDRVRMCYSCTVFPVYCSLNSVQNIAY